MRKVLYLVTSPRALGDSPLVVTQKDQGREMEVVLLQDAVGITEVPTSHVSVLKDDLVARGLSSPFTPISYKELLDKIFLSDVVVTL